MIVASYLLVALVGYLVGGIPTAYLAGRLRGIDIRRHGSGNVGGTNALRVLGWKLGLPVMALDVGKGYLVTAFLPRLPLGRGEPVSLALAAGLGAFLGHVFSPYLRFRGGKGVATGAGVVLALAPLPAALSVAVFVLVVFGTGIVSLGSLSAAVTFPVGAFLLDRYANHPISVEVRALAVGLAVLVFFTHRSNLRRLATGRENRFRRLWERTGK